MFDSDNTFGGSLIKKFNIGDLVSWTELQHYTDQEKCKKLGVISEIKNVIRSERPVAIAKILDLERAKEKEIMLISLTLVSKAKENSV